MHKNVIFPDFSAFQMTIPGAAARVGPDHPDGSTAPGHSPGRAGGRGTARAAVPPFSWLGADAWPNFPTPPQRQP
jgi:hypothetical protein